VNISVVIVDDEPPARTRLRRLLAAHPDISIAGECADGASAVQTIESTAPDLVLLDVQMPELDGFEVLQSLDMSASAGEELRWDKPRLPEIIFVSAFDQYALRAFQVHALDYVVKPVEADRLSDALDHARQRLRDRSGTADPRLANLLGELTRTRPFLTRMPVRSDNRVRVIDLADVDWIAAADNYVALHCGAREFLVRDTIAAIERRLDPANFVRIHRSTIVRIDRIVELLPDLHGDFRVRLTNGATLALSRTYRPRLEERFGRRL
jgi:two-component system LytT family response regulator